MLVGTIGVLTERTAFGQYRVDRRSLIRGRRVSEAEGPAKAKARRPEMHSLIFPIRLSVIKNECELCGQRHWKQALSGVAGWSIGW